MSSKITALPSKSKHNTALKVPKHLTAASRHFYEQICNDYVLESHHLRLLQLLCEAFDRGQQARKLLATEGLTGCRFEAWHQAAAPVGFNRT